MDVVDFDAMLELPSDSNSTHQILDFDEMECENYDDGTRSSVMEQQPIDIDSNITIAESSESSNYHHITDVLSLPPYDNFVKNLKQREGDSFENMKNSTTIPNVIATNERVVKENSECPRECPIDYCNCEACLQMYFDTETSDFQNDLHSNYYIDLFYDFTTLWNEFEPTTYADLPEFVYST